MLKKTITSSTLERGQNYDPVKPSAVNHNHASGRYLGRHNTFFKESQTCFLFHHQWIWDPTELDPEEGRWDPFPLPPSLCFPLPSLCCSSPSPSHPLCPAGKCKKNFWNAIKFSMFLAPLLPYWHQPPPKQQFTILRGKLLSCAHRIGHEKVK